MRLHLNAGNLWTLPASSSVPRRGDAIDWLRIRAAGFVGLQHYFPDAEALDAGLEMSGMARIVDPAEAAAVAARHRDWGFVCSTWHVGTGLESDAEMDTLAAAVLNAAARTGLAVYIETHRATMTQDIRRTLDLCARFPELRFNADLSHWYTGLEMRYGDFEHKLSVLAPIFARTRYIHGRIGDSCTMQLPLAEARTRPAWQDYMQLWRGCLTGFAAATDDEPTIFAPELLPQVVEHAGARHRLNYAKLVDGVEISDRWAEALELVTLIAELAQQASVPSP